MKEWHTGGTASQYCTKAVDVEVGSEDGLDLALEDSCGLITAQVAHTNGVVTTETMCAQQNLAAGQVVISSYGSRHVLLDCEGTLLHVGCISNKFGSTIG